MVTIKTNLPEVLSGLREKIANLSNKNYIPRALAFGIIDKITDRIHNEGLASDGSPIGNYTSNYLKLRENKYNRSSDTKIIVSLTRQLENDWAVIATDKGYGVGFNNSFNKDKLVWVEQIKARVISNLTSSEEQYVTETAQQLVTDGLK